VGREPVRQLAGKQDIAELGRPIDDGRTVVALGLKVIEVEAAFAVSV
jgi:hypothetical protein